MTPAEAESDEDSNEDKPGHGTAYHFRFLTIIDFLIRKVDVNVCLR